MKSNATSVREYIADLPQERREAIEIVRKLILENLPDGYEETMNWGMISYEVPLSIYPDTYNGKPLSYAALASQKNHMAVYLSSIYTDQEKRDEFERKYIASGKRYDAGQSCVRFKELDDLPMPLIAEAVRSIPINEFVATAKKVLDKRKTRKKS